MPNPMPKPLGLSADFSSVSFSSADFSTSGNLWTPSDSEDTFASAARKESEATFSVLATGTNDLSVEIFCGAAFQLGCCSLAHCRSNDQEYSQKQEKNSPRQGPI